MNTKSRKDQFKIVIARWLLTLFVGFLTGITALVVDLAIRGIVQYKFQWMFQLVEITNEGFWAPFLAYLAMNIALCSASALLVTLVEPVAGGSGIPEIKCYLNGVKIPHVVRLGTLFAKAVGVIFSVSGGLAVGKEGPMIHSGAVIAAGISQGTSSSIPIFKTPLLKDFRNDREKRDFVSGGAAAGVSAAFGAPIGGVLFSLEEGSSFWNQELTWRTFFCAIVSVFTLNFFLSGTTGLKQWGAFNNPGLVNFGSFADQANAGWVVAHVPFFVFLAVCGGLFGALFNAINLKLTKLRRRYVHTVARRWLEVVVVALITASVGFLAPYALGRCVALSKDAVDNPGISTSFYCPKGTRNSMASVFFVSFEEAIRELFHNEVRYDRSTLFAFFCLMFVLTVITYGIAVPSGLFVPALLMGATFGRLAGDILREVIPQLDFDPGTFALIGAAGMLGGVVRMTISLTVILMESTNDMSYALPLMITLMVAKWIGDAFNNGLYDLHIELARVPLLGWEPPFIFRKFFARDVMSRHLVTIGKLERVRDVVTKLLRSPHNGFPVLNKSDRFVGLILRSQLIAMLRARSFQVGRHAPRQVRRYAVLDRDAFLDVYPRCPDLLRVLHDHLGIEHVHDAIERREGIFGDDMYLNVAPYMNRAPFTVWSNASLSRVFRLFRTMGLRHLAVLDANGLLCGMVTRSDLVHLKERLLSRRENRLL